MQLSNSTFQWIWFKILKKIYYPKQNKGLIGVQLLEYYAGYMLAYVKWAKKLTKLDMACIGDSNGQEMHDYESMRRFGKPSINLAIASTRADDWNGFFHNTEKGKAVYLEIKFLKNVLINVGGNNILQNKFSILESELKVLNSLIMNATFITIPVIYAELTSQLIGKSASTIKTQINKANGWIKQYKNIDITPFTGNDENPYWFALHDFVHFSNEFDYKVRIPLINKTLWGV